MQKKTIVSVCVILFILTTGTAFGQVFDLSLDPSDIRFEPVYSNGTVLGYNLCRTDIVFAANMKLKELNMSSGDSDTFDADQVVLYNAERWAAVASLLNTYEFACDQYKKNKIDKKAFKTFYFCLIKDIKTNPDYAAHFNTNDGKVKYQAINDVYMKWHGDNTH